MAKEVKPLPEEVSIPLTKTFSTIASVEGEVKSAHVYGGCICVKFASGRTYKISMQLDTAVAVLD